MICKRKFKPEVYRIKLSQEQAVLRCACYSDGYQFWRTDAYYNVGVRTMCVGGANEPKRNSSRSVCSPRGRGGVVWARAISSSASS